VVKKINNNEIKIVLASASPRRRILLRGLLNNFGLKFVVKPANIDEYIPKNVKDYGDLASGLASEKADFVAEKTNGIIIAADTIVVFKGKVMGKPGSAAEAKKMLSILSSNTHEVYTGLVILEGSSGNMYKTYEVTQVKFRKLLPREINYYVNSKAPMDKAGAYGIQDDLGSTFVSSIKGDYFNVVGMPIVKTYNGLQKFIKLI
jgi:septum formation protein